MASPRQSILIKIPPTFDESMREVLGRDIINFIVNRTKNGLDKDGNPFRGYSKRYKESLDFRLAGKSPRPVDLTLSGEMLNDLVIIRHGIGFIVIGFLDSESNDKAFFNKENSRLFLGLSEAELNEVIGSRSVIPTSGEFSDTFIGELVRRLIG